MMFGETFSERQLDSLRHVADSGSPDLVRSLTATDIAIIRLRILENRWQAGKSDAANAEFDLAQNAVVRALAGMPSNSFLWLAAYWLQHEKGANPTQLLRMSYVQGPNEGWIAVKRNPLALNVFPSLSEELANDAVLEFRGLVRTGLYREAARILAGPGSQLRGKLLSQLPELKKNERRLFAAALESAGLDSTLVLGAEPYSSRPFDR